jgi:hypothetical protein
MHMCLVFVTICQQLSESYRVEITGKVIHVLNGALRHEDVCESEGIAPPFLTSVLDGGEWLASCPCRFTSGKEPPVLIL